MNLNTNLRSLTLHLHLVIINTYFIFMRVFVSYRFKICQVGARFKLKYTYIGSYNNNNN